MELPKRIVVLSHRTLPFEDLDENSRLVVSVRRERLSLLRGKMVLRSMSFVVASPTVSKSIDKGVTSKNSRFCTCDDPSPMRMAACIGFHEDVLWLRIIGVVRVEVLLPVLLRLLLLLWLHLLQ